jgi:hypothetical protein
MYLVTRFSIQDIIITLSIIRLFILTIIIEFAPILITGTFILIAVDLGYITYYFPKRKALGYKK